jgi:hypothetical protein
MEPEITQLLGLACFVAAIYAGGRFVGIEKGRREGRMEVEEEIRKELEIVRKSGGDLMMANGLKDEADLKSDARALWLIGQVVSNEDGTVWYETDDARDAREQVEENRRYSAEDVVARHTEIRRGKRER